ncbi:uncharacterized protein EDB93DRAFT_1330192 [Suillus bovinus]|uniref:uncharacterized protein n=1 Tax=Suillus bovinus TaxID=48563 RepID=UPI001B875453|nr:uncharacterized protein EDB93DRAFT_1330192 [Suillus bovinus]KAG2139809.1 hypothetical protein EDB93DRAFT_1330192 [Suillus bovinus]
MSVDIHDTFGAGFIGGMVTAILYGITTLQTYLYYVYYPTDPNNLKVLVAFIWVIDTLHISFMCHALYYYLVTSFGNPDNLGTGVWSLFASLGLNLCMAVLVQTYFTFQISCLTRSNIRWWLTSFIMLFVVAHFAFGLETVILMFIKQKFSALSEITLYAATPFAIAAVLSDLFIAASLCILLHGNRSPVVQTNALVNTLIVYAINRCLLTSVVAVAEVIAVSLGERGRSIPFEIDIPFFVQFSVSPDSLWFIAIDFVIGKLYANSLLASLNSRSALRARSHTHNDSTSFRVNTINLTGLQSSSDNEGTQSKTTTSTVSARVRVKSIPGGDIDELDVSSCFFGLSHQLTTEMKTGTLREV